MLLKENMKCIPSLCSLFCFTFWQKSTSMLPWNPCASPDHRGLSGPIKISCTPDIHCTTFILLAFLRPCMCCRAGGRSLLVCPCHCIRLSWGLWQAQHPLPILSALTAVLQIWNIYWHFLKSLKILMWESKVCVGLGFLNMSLYCPMTSWKQSPDKRVMLFIQCSSVYILLFLITFQARHRILANLVYKLLWKEKLPQK